MKNKPEKKSAEPKKSPATRARTKKADASSITPAAKIDAPKKIKAVKPQKTRTTSPFDENATSPLSKESPAIQTPKKTATPAPSPETNVKTKPGKRPIRPSIAPGSEVKIPALLLEGDQPPPSLVSGPGSRYALAPQTVRPAPLPSAGELPDAYGTGRVFLAARDPHWLYVSWDFTNQQQSRYNALSRDGHLVIRIFARDQNAPAIPDVHVHPESRNWFVHVPYARTAYRAEIGFFNSTGTWQSISVSQETFTPPDAPSNDVTTEFATIPVEVTFQQVVEAVQQFVTVSNTEPLLDAVAAATQVQREHGMDLGTAQEGKIKTPELPRTSVTVIGDVAPSARARKRREPLPIHIYEDTEWTLEKREALARLIHIDSLRRVWMGSMEITGLVRRQLQEEIASITVAEKKKRRAVFGEEAVGLKMDVSSPSGGEFPTARKFWFKINAELIIYGATEPDATVTIADRPIKLRPDGTFSFRFSLPDGRYHLPAVAISSDGEDGREARLEFSRSTEYRGDVQSHLQDSALRPPRPEHLK